MRYLLMICTDEAAIEALSEADESAVLAEYGAFETDIELVRAVYDELEGTKPPDFDPRPSSSPSVRFVHRTRPLSPSR